MTEIIRTKPCSVSDCINSWIAKGYCNKHYLQVKKYGEVQTVNRTGKYKRTEKHIAICKKAVRSRKTTSGWKWSDEARQRLSAKVAGRTLNTGKTHFKKGQKSWNKGVSGWMKDDHLQSIILADTGRIPWNKIGEGITAESKLARHKFSNNVRLKVLERDDYTCQICCKRGGSLQVDHIKSWSKYPDLRFDQDNYRTICMACHYYQTFKRKIPTGIVWGHNLSRRITS